MLTKYCPTCQTTKNVGEFSVQRRSSDGRQSECKACKKAYDKQYYQHHKAAALARNSARNKGLREYVAQYLLAHPCVDCGEKDIVVLEFDHVRGKKHKHVMRMAGGSFSIARLQAEIDKCDVVCANCHRRRTVKRAGGTRLRYS